MNSSLLGFLDEHRQNLHTRVSSLAATTMEVSSSHGLAVQLLAVAAVGLVTVVYRAFRVPAELRHLPRVSIFRLLISYLTVEMENNRLERLLMPFAKRGDGVVVVWALGRWMVHILDEKVTSSGSPLWMKY